MYRGFTNARELAWIRGDFEAMVASSESHTFTFKYVTNVLKASNDPVYGHAVGGINEEVEVEKKGFIIIFKKNKSEEFGIEFIEAGDTVMFFYETMDLNELEPGKPAEENTLRIVDAAGNRWVPNIRKSKGLERAYSHLLGEQTLATVIVCSKLEGEENEA